MNFLLLLDSHLRQMKYAMNCYWISSVESFLSSRLGVPSHCNHYEEWHHPKVFLNSDSVFGRIEILELQSCQKKIGCFQSWPKGQLWKHP